MFKHAFKSFLAMVLLATPLSVIATAAGATSAQAATYQTRVVWERSRAVVVAGSSVRFEGQVQAYNPTASEWQRLSTQGTATLQRQYVGTTTWANVATSSALEHFVFSVPVRRNTTYRVVYTPNDASFAPATSGTYRVNARRKITTRASGMRITGRVTPQFNKRYLRVVRRTCAKCSWKLVKRVRTTAKGYYAVRLGTPARGSWYYRFETKADTKFVLTRSSTYRTYRTYYRKAS